MITFINQVIAYRLFLELDPTTDPVKVIFDQVGGANIEDDEEPTEHDGTNSILVANNGVFAAGCEKLVSILPLDDGLTFKTDNMINMTLGEKDTSIGNLGLKGYLNVTEAVTINNMPVGRNWHVLGLLDLKGNYAVEQHGLTILKSSPSYQTSRLGVFDVFMGGPCVLGQNLALNIAFQSSALNAKRIKIEAIVHLFGQWDKEKLVMKVGDQPVAAVGKVIVQSQGNPKVELTVLNLDKPSSLSKKLVAVVPYDNSVKRISFVANLTSDMCQKSWGLASLIVSGSEA